jgi:hypothetical protein
MHCDALLMKNIHVTPRGEFFSPRHRAGASDTSRPRLRLIQGEDVSKFGPPLG